MGKCLLGVQSNSVHAVAVKSHFSLHFCSLMHSDPFIFTTLKSLFSFIKDSRCLWRLQQIAVTNTLENHIHHI